jgi:hypothetical protein
MKKKSIFPPPTGEIAKTSGLPTFVAERIAFVL